MRTGRQRPGFTYVELICALLILAALMGVVAPLISSYVGDAQYTTTRATLKTLRDAIIAYNHDMKLPAAWATAPTTPPGTTGIPLTLMDLVVQPAGANSFNPITRTGWRGPYLLQATGEFTTSLNSTFSPYGNTGDPAFIDAWGDPIVLQWPQSQNGDPVSVYGQYVRLVSAGRPVPASGSTTFQGSIVTPANTAGNPIVNGIPYSYYAPTTAQRGQNLVLFIFVQDPYPYQYP